MVVELELFGQLWWHLRTLVPLPQPRADRLELHRLVDVHELLGDLRRDRMDPTSVPTGDPYPQLLLLVHRLLRVRQLQLRLRERLPAAAVPQPDPLDEQLGFLVHRRVVADLLVYPQPDLHP